MKYGAIWAILIFINATVGGGWSKIYGGEGIDLGYSVQQTDDGGYIIGGATTSFTTNFDAWLIKTDENGNVEWNKTYGDNDDEACYCVRQIQDGYILVGTKHISEKISHIWLIKTDENGNVEWNKTYGDNACGRYIEQTQDGGYIIMGNIYDEGCKIWLIKTDENGNVEWNKTYDGICITGEQTKDGGYIIGGNIASSKAILIKTDENGNVEWQRTYNGLLSSVSQTRDGGYIIGGIVTRYDIWHWYSHTDIQIIKTDSLGNIKWKKTFGTGGYEQGGYAAECDSGYIITGETVAVRATYGDGFYDIWLIKIDSSGNEEWLKKIGDEKSGEYAKEVHQTGDTYIIIGTVDNDILLVKTGKPVVEIRATYEKFRGISAIVKNNGNKLLNINWSIYIEGIVFTKRYYHGSISLEAGKQTTIGTQSIFGIGPLTVIITAGETAKVLHFFLIGYMMLPMDI